MPIKFCWRQQGFTMIEVLITLLIVAVGLLGIASLQMLALNNTGIARNRSVAALQADGLASMMHANQAYWQTATVATGDDITGSTFTSSPVCLNPSSPCSATDMATYDFQQWLAGVAASLPTGSGKVNCVKGSSPVSCTIYVYWNENNVAINSSTNTSAATAFGIGSSFTQTYTLVVQP